MAFKGFFITSRWWLVFAALFFLLEINPASALEARSFVVKLPHPFKLIDSAGYKSKYQKDGDWHLTLVSKQSFPIVIVVQDPFGADIELLIQRPDELQRIALKQEIITHKMPNQSVLYTAPKLCPRIHFSESGQGIYETKTDLLNHKPILQSFDPDYGLLPLQRLTLKEFDQNNVLQILAVSVSYDYEDNTILDYQGPNPVTARPQLIYEGEGGYYANFHIAVLPYKEGIESLARQEILNLAEGKLRYIDRSDLTPLLRTHSFLPGPYLSKKNFYELCEWGDSSFRRVPQQLQYRDFYVWDWDLMKSSQIKTDAIAKDRILIIVWEGDEEDWLIQDQLLDPYYLTDDLVGVFDVKLSETQGKELTLENKRGDFKMVVTTVSK